MGHYLQCWTRLLGQDAGPTGIQEVVGSIRQDSSVHVKVGLAIDFPTADSSRTFISYW